MLIGRKISNKIQKIVLRFPKLILFCNVGFWFVIGMLLSYLFVIIPLFRQIEFFNDHISLASLMAILFGFIGGIFVLMRIEPNEDVQEKE